MIDFNQTSQVDNGGCRSGSWYDNKTNICRRKEYIYLEWDDVVATIFIITSFLCILLNVFAFFVFYKNRKTPLVKAANRELSFLLLVLLLLAFLIPLTHIGMPTVPLCITHIVIQGPLMTGILSIFLVKTHRVIIIFHARHPRVTSRQWFLKQRLQVVVVFTLVIVQIVTVVTYVAFKQPEIMLYGYEDITTKYVYVECSYGGGLAFGFTYVYVITIALVGFIMAFRSRHLPSNFRESRHIAASLATTLIVHGAMLPAAPLTHGRINAIITCLALFVSPLGQLSFLFFPKCYIILFCPQRNTVRELRRMTLAHMQRRSEFSLNVQALPPLEARNAHECTDSQPQSPTCLMPDSTETQKHEGNKFRSVFFIDDEYRAATDNLDTNPRELVNITLRASATIEGIRSYGIHGSENLAFEPDQPDLNQYVHDNKKQRSRPRSISAEESVQSADIVHPKHEKRKRKSEPTIHIPRTFQSAQQLCVFSVTGTLSASATFLTQKKRCKSTNIPNKDTDNITRINCANLETTKPRSKSLNGTEYKEIVPQP